MKAVIRWHGGERVIDDVTLGDPRIADQLDRLAAIRAKGVALTFASDDPDRRHCIECGCTDDAACWDEANAQPCHWLRMDVAAGLGVCSACPEAAERFDAGDRELAVPV